MLWRLNLSVFCLFIFLFLFACSGAPVNYENRTKWLPYSMDNSPDKFDTFEKFLDAFDAVIEGESCLADLKSLGLYGTSNIEERNFLQIQEMFWTNDSIKLKDLPDGIIKCLNYKKDCRGYELNPQKILKARVGPFFKDFMQTLRVERETGWQVNALFVIVDDRVVYKHWSGRRDIDLIKENFRPLGPFQGIDISKSAEGMVRGFLP